VERDPAVNELIDHRRGSSQVSACEFVSTSINGSRVVRIGFEANGERYLVSLGFVWRQDALYAMTTRGRKTRMAAANPTKGAVLEYFEHELKFNSSTAPLFPQTDYGKLAMPNAMVAHLVNKLSQFGGTA
jgi:hypothetical protein